MEQKIINKGKWIANLVLFSISAMLSVNLFINFSKTLWIQGLLGAMALSIETVKLYSFILAKASFKEFLSRPAFWSKSWIAGIFQFIFYLVLTLISIVASLGFIRVEIEGQSFQARTLNIDQDVIMADLKLIDREINNKLRQQEELGGDYVTASGKLTDQIKNIRAQREELLLKLKTAQQTNEHKVVSSDMFFLLGDLINWSEKQTMFWLMLMLSILLEVCIAVTSGTVVQRKFQSIGKENRSKLISYINYLVGEGARLNSDQYISKETQIPPHECYRYRKLLNSISFRGKNLIDIRQGGSKANYSKENIIKIVMFHLDNQESGGN